MFSLPHDIMCGYYDSVLTRSRRCPKKRIVENMRLSFLPMTDRKLLDENTVMIKRDHVLIAKPGQVRCSRLPFKTAYVKFNAEGEIAKDFPRLRIIFPVFHRSPILTT